MSPESDGSLDYAASFILSVHQQKIDLEKQLNCEAEKYGAEKLHFEKLLKDKSQENNALRVEAENVVCEMNEKYALLKDVSLNLISRFSL